jgi:DNA-binding GntR family transcriptional regulator
MVLSREGPTDVRRRTTANLVADYLRERIVSGKLPPGQRLSVVACAAELGFSQTPTREALQLLAHEGLVTLHAYKEATVAELSADDYEEIFVMRVGLEGLAARLGAEKITDAGIELLRSNLAELGEAARAQDIDRFIEVDRRFHHTHYTAAGRERLWSRIINLRTTAERYTRLGYQLPGIGLTDTVNSHTRLFNAVERRDGERARHEIVSDLTNTYDIVRAAVLESETAHA